MWLRLVRADVARRPASIALNGALLALAAAVLAAFALVLPTYRASFTAAVESAAFDVDLAACGCTSADIARLRSHKIVA